jgi:hypothetical protein
MVKNLNRLNAKNLFKRTDLKDIDDILKDNFVKGLKDARLREKVRLKLNKIRNIAKDDLYDIDDLIKYAKCHSESFDDVAANSCSQVTTSDSSSISSVHSNESYLNRPNNYRLQQQNMNGRQQQRAIDNIKIVNSLTIISKAITQIWPSKTTLVITCKITLRHNNHKQ